MKYLLLPSPSHPSLAPFAGQFYPGRTSRKHEPLLDFDTPVREAQWRAGALVWGDGHRCAFR